MELNQDPYQQAELLLRYLRGEANPAEIEQIENWLAADIRYRQFLDALQSEQGLVEERDFFDPYDKNIAWKNIRQVINPKHNIRWPRIAAVAAAMLLTVSAGVYLALRLKTQPVQVAQVQTRDIVPGRNQATLTLANGQKIILTKGLNGQLATQGLTVIRAHANSISYQAEKRSGQISYNTLTTARGERSPYPLVLADGTKVWLNAASSITFPTAFRDKERIVKITGEAYFEVAHNNRQTFKVESAGQVTQDIGTHFNIMAYADEPAIKVTLTEGAVKVNGNLLRPGEQSINSNGVLKVSEANVAFALAWKDGYFRFSDAPITEVMRELARWYNIEVVYEGQQTRERFNAKISRYKNISAILHILERTKGVHFKIEGRRVTVLNKA